ncbi:hypothetical protein C8R47DRAFT_739364 [Mycena vitilis]|nr:hypothetical protein C8R47DRAFT_739364 [Mycena vitilis]
MRLAKPPHSPRHAAPAPLCDPQRPRARRRRGVGVHTPHGAELARGGAGAGWEPPLPTPTPPFPPQSRAAHALHARLLSWFLDAPAAPFGVHPMALAGKAAGKDVGCGWGRARRLWR